jgi:hypothetical protein
MDSMPQPQPWDTAACRNCNVPLRRSARDSGSVHPPRRPAWGAEILSRQPRPSASDEAVRRWAGVHLIGTGQVGCRWQPRRRYLAGGLLVGLAAPYGELHALRHEVEVGHGQPVPSGAAPRPARVAAGRGRAGRSDEWCRRCPAGLGGRWCGASSPCAVPCRGSAGCATRVMSAEDHLSVGQVIVLIGHDDEAPFAIIVLSQILRNLRSSLTRRRVAGNRQKVYASPLYISR